MLSNKHNFYETRLPFLWALQPVANSCFCWKVGGISAIQRNATHVSGNFVLWVFFLILFNVEIPLSHMNEWLSFVYWRLSRNLSRFKFSYTNFISVKDWKWKFLTTPPSFWDILKLDWPRNQSCQQKCTFSFKIYFDIVVVKIGTCCRCGNSRSKIEKKTYFTEDHKLYFVHIFLYLNY